MFKKLSKLLRKVPGKTYRFFVQGTGIKRLRMLYQKIKRGVSNRYQCFLINAAKRLKQKIIMFLPILRPRHSLPYFIIKEAKILSDIEPSLFPSAEYLILIKKVKIPCGKKFGKKYAKAYTFCQRHDFDTLIITDQRKLPDHYYEEKLPLILHTRRTLFFTGLPYYWSNKAPYFNIGKLSYFMSGEDQELLLVRLLMQLNCKKIYFINSKLGSKALSKYEKALSSLDSQIVNLPFQRAGSLAAHEGGDG